MVQYDLRCKDHSRLGSHGVAIALVLCMGSSTTRGQDLEQVGKKDGFKLTGGLSAYTGFYSSDLDDPRMSPLTWGLSARVNVSIYDLQIPFTLVLSERERDFRQPFNQYGVSPRYKWVRLHLGYRTMQFSDLTLGGQRFFGAGLELTPGKLRFGAMYGRLRKEIYQDTTIDAVVEPAFERWAMAAKMGVGTEASHLDLIVFRAEDRVDANAFLRGDYGTAQPEENAVVGVDVAQSPWKGVQVNVTAALSLANQGLVPDERSGSGEEVSNNYDSFLFNLDRGTQHGTAVKGGISYNLRGMVIGAKYDRIDPLFRTLGNYYFMRDVENYRATLAFGLLKQKLRFQLEGGRQHNDLAHVLAARTERTIASVNMTYASGKMYTGSFTWSDFAADLTSVFQAAGTDAVQITQVSRSLGTNHSFRFRDVGRDRSHTVDIGGTWQTFSNEGDTAHQSSTNAYTVNMGYRVQLKSRHLTLGITGMGSRFEAEDQLRLKYGCSVNARKGFDADRLGVAPRLSAYLNSAEESSGVLSLVASLGVDRKIGRSQTIGMQLGYNSRQALGATDPAQYQVRGQVTYTLTLQPPARKATDQSTKP